MNTILKTTMTLAVAATFITGCGGGTSSSDTGTTGSTTSGDTDNTGTPSDGSSQSSGGIFSYKELQWQDDETLESEMVEYAYRNDYCDALSLGGNTDWRLPTVAEYSELNEVKDLLDFSWSEENYIFWTADEATSGGKEYISMYNLSQGGSILFIVDNIFSEWGVRCVRGGSVEEDQEEVVVDDNTEPVENEDISLEGDLNDIFQHHNSTFVKELTHIYLKDKPDAKAVYFSNSSGRFDMGTSEWSVSGDFEMFSGETIHKGDTLVTMSQQPSGSTEKNIIYTVTYLGEYKSKNYFVRIHHPFSGETYISVMHPYSGNFDNLMDEALEYGGIEAMYTALFE